MKIIKRGQKPAERVYKTNCRTCETVFEWAQYEGELIPDFRDGDFYQIKCPVCGQLCTHAARKP